MITHQIGISNPEFEIENLRYLIVKSSFLKGRGDITVFVPPGHEEGANLPVAILLHGVYASHWAWTRHMNVHNVALEMIQNKTIQPMILAMPSDGLWGDGSGYFPHSGMDFEKWIAEDVVTAIREAIPQAGAESKFFLTGLSMGGYGALRVGCKYPAIFSAVSGHSSVTDLEDLETFIEEDVRSVLSEPEIEETSVFNVILKNKKTLPPILFDCGTEDQLIESNRKLHQQLEQAEVKHIYREFSGAHTAEYWAEHIQDSLVFFNGFI